MSWDPLNATMDLFGELQELAKREREVDESYLKMADECERFALDLLGVNNLYTSSLSAKMPARFEVDLLYHFMQTTFSENCTI